MTPFVAHSTSSLASATANRVSVALCTYNGARFLRQQLDSIAHQTCLPTELVVCDDRSTDDTLDIVQAFAKRAPFAVRWTVNEQNLGSSRNFAKAIRLCQYDYIALADQDDVWLPEKLEMLSTALAESTAAFAFSDARLIDATGKTLPSTLWNRVGLRGRRQRRMISGEAFPTLLQDNLVTGATMMFRAADIAWLLPVPEGWVHDAWLALALSARFDCRPLREPLIEYRLHAGQQIGAYKQSWLRQYQAARRMDQQRFAQIANGLAELRERVGRLASGQQRALDNAIDHWQRRLRMRQQSRFRLPAILNEWARGRYARYSRGWKSVAQDLVM